MAGRRIVAVLASAGLIGALTSGAGHVPGFSAGEAQASCITWQGGENCDSPAPPRSFHYQAPVRRGGGGGGYRSYGGGGGRAGAALGAASAAIGILGMMIDAAQQEQNNANEAQRQAYNACQGRYRQSYAINEQARKIAANGDTEEAYGEFERALNVLGSCGSRSDLSKLRDNLEGMRKEYARLSTPSAEWAGDDRTNAPKKAAIYPGALDPAARQLCSFAAEGSDSWQACMAARKAEAIMATDPDIRAACQSIADVDARNQCVFNRYWAGVQGKDPNQFGDNKNCYWDEHGKPCYPGGKNAAAASAPSNADSDPNSLRNRLKRALADNAKDKASDVDAARAAEIARAKAVRDSLPEGSADRKTLDDAIAKAEAGQTPSASADTGGSNAGSQTAQNGGAQNGADTGGAAPGAGKSRDDAYDNYMNSGNANSGGNNRGDLGHSGFSMNGSDTDREVNRLMGR